MIKFLLHGGLSHHPERLDDKLSYHPASPDDTTKDKREFLPILKPSGPDDGIKFPPKFCKTLTSRLPPEDGSVRPQTLGKRVSDDSRHFIFRRRKENLANIFDKNFHPKNFCRKIDKLHFFPAMDFST